MGYVKARTGLVASDSHLDFTLNGQTLFRLDREMAERFASRLKKWADGWNLTEGAFIGLKSTTRILSDKDFVTFLYRGYPILRMNHDQTRRFVSRIDAWVDTEKMKPVDKIMRELKNQEKELRENGIDMDIANTG